MSARKWVQNPAGYLEEIDCSTGEVIQREKKRQLPRVFSVNGRGPGRPSKSEIGPAGKYATARKRRLYPYSPEIGELICDAVVVGENLTALNPTHGFPPYQEICRWRREHPDFDRKIRISIECRSFYFEDQALAVVREAKDAADVPAARLKFEAYMWAAAMSDPARFARKPVPTRQVEEAAPRFIISTGFPDSNELMIELSKNGVLKSTK
jgi:hypothetical protein